MCDVWYTLTRCLLSISLSQKHYVMVTRAPFFGRSVLQTEEGGREREAMSMHESDMIFSLTVHRRAARSGPIGEMYCGGVPTRHPTVLLCAL